MSVRHSRDASASEHEFEVRFLKSRGLAFQDLFSEVMENAYPGDFMRVRPHGRLGDFKCDGYLPSQKTVFQVYGPDEMRSLRTLLKKIQDDFDGALRYWKDRMSRWVFVHNCVTGLSAPAVQLLDDLGTQHPELHVENWSYQDLLRILRRRSSRGELDPIAPSDESHHLPKPSTVKRFWAPYWKWLKTCPELSISSPFNDAKRILDIPVMLVSSNTTHRDDVRRETEIRTYLATPSGAVKYHDASPLKRSARAIDLQSELLSYRQLLIVGDSGSGKSTLLRRFARDEAKHLYKNGLSKQRRHTPVVVELWRFGRNRSLLELIVGAIRRSGLAVDVEQLTSIMERGYITLLLDGLDEISMEDRRECLGQILGLVDEHPEMPLVITSRPFPAPPAQFHELVIAPLTDSDIAAALTLYFGSKRAFQRRFDNYSPTKYVEKRLQPEVLQLCRRPLTLILIMALLKNEGDLPATLYGVYDRFLWLMLDWEERKGNLKSVVAAASLLEEAAYILGERDDLGIRRIDLIRDAGLGLQTLRYGSVPPETNAESIFGLFLSMGLMKEVGGELSFSHKTFLEFLTARRILRQSAPPESDSRAMRLGVARFLFGKMEDVSDFLEGLLERCDDVDLLMPLLWEADNSGADIGRFKALRESIALGHEMDIELTYSREDREEEFSRSINQLVKISIDLRPRALSILKNAAHGILTARPWEQSREWFEQIVVGLNQYKWAGADLHTRLSRVFFGQQSDVDDDDLLKRDEALFSYLESISHDDFDGAAKYLNEIEEFHARWSENAESRGLNKSLSRAVVSQQLELPEHLEDPSSFLEKNPYGWLFGDGDCCEYDFVWVASPEALFDSVYDSVLLESENEGSDDMAQEWRDCLNRARQSFESFGLSDETFAILFSKSSERSGMCWWGTFDGLKGSDVPWAEQVRSSFREGGNPHPIEAHEELRFADYVTRQPFRW
jgi:hypothetical protein